MSQQESQRRKLLKYVMKKAWSIFRKSCNITFSHALKLAWRLLRGYSSIRYSKARGTTFNDKQRILSTLLNVPYNHIGIYLERDKENMYHSKAIKIIATIRKSTIGCIGYISKELADKLSPILDSGNTVLTFYEGVTGRNKGTLGLNFSFVII